MKLGESLRVLKSPHSQRTMAQMGIISGPLGMMLDNQHGLFGVLTYNQWKLTFPQDSLNPFLKSALWVPPTFAAAGVVMTALILVLDRLLDTPHHQKTPTWPRVFASISYFSAQYWLSGGLDAMRVSTPLIQGILAMLAAYGWQRFDGSIAGALLGVATALAGPLTEILLINGTGAYYYTHADWLGIDTWIPWVYFLGEAGVGNLARALYNMNMTTDVDSGAAARKG